MGDDLKPMTMYVKICDDLHGARAIQIPPGGVSLVLPDVPIRAARVLRNDGATIVFWNDGTKTVTKLSVGDKYDPVLGVLICALRKASKNRARIDTWERMLRKLTKHLIALRPYFDRDGLIEDIRTLSKALELAATALERERGEK